MLLLVDWCFNRMYLNVSMLIWYPLLGFLIFFAYLEIARVEVAAAAHTHELSIFDIHPSGLSYVLPTLVPLIVYLATRLKFWLLAEGDCDIQE